MFVIHYWVKKLAGGTVSHDPILTKITTIDRALHVCLWVYIEKTKQKIRSSLKTVTTSRQSTRSEVMM